MSAIKIEIVAFVHHGRDRLHTPGREAPSDEGQQADATFILGKHCDRGAWRLGIALLLEERGDSGLKLGPSVRLFLAWDGRGRFGLARNFPRTQAYTPE